MSILKVAAIQNAAGVEVYTAKAWVNFNGTGTVAIRAAGNVSSITDNGVGDYTVNFTTAMADANYSAVANSGDTGTPGNQGRIAEPQTLATGSVRIVTYGGSFTKTDFNLVTVAIFR